MKRIITLSLAITVMAAIGYFGVRGARSQDQNNGKGHEQGPPEVLHHTNPHEVGDDLTAGGTGIVTPVITNHGGPIIATPTMYIIWYGNWNQSNGSDTPAGQQIVRDFANHISGSPYFNINTSYSSQNSSVTGNVLFGGEATDTGSRGTRLRDSDIQTIVNSAISLGHLRYDQNGVYFVLTSSNVRETSGFCTQYCGWHTAGTPSAGHIRYSFVGNANRCLFACAAQTVGPNGNAGVDAMISVIAHELEEATTDPDLNAWYDSQGAENADKCAWTFGHAQYQVGNGAWANMKLGTRDFLIQRNLSAADSNCYIDYNNRIQ
jgi:hypothetical protein